MGVKGGGAGHGIAFETVWDDLPCVFDNRMVKCYTDGHIAGKFKAVALPDGQVGIEFVFDKANELPATVRLLLHWGRVYSRVKTAKETKERQSLTVPRLEQNEGKGGEK